MVKIYDCFPFFNELEILEIRLSELYDSVDYFVICESTVTHSGKPKPLYYEKNKERYKRWQDKIIHLVYKPEKKDFAFTFFNWLGKFSFMKNKFSGRIYDIFGLGRWRIESSQRDCLFNGLKKAKNDDIIFLSDADEIWNPKIIKDINKRLPYDKVICLKQKMFYYYLNGKADQIWKAANVVRYGLLKRMKSIDKIRNWKKYERIIGFILKKYPAKKREVVWKNGGWHFSYLGGVNKIKEKIENLTHFENDTAEIKSNENLMKKIDSGKFLGRTDINIKYIKVDDSFPITIQKNKEKYKHLIKK